MSETRPVESWLTDMDGVLVREDHAIPGGSEFITALDPSFRAQELAFAVSSIGAIADWPSSG